jgi:ubiquinone/menaquinone biosynthesis methyltransferase
MGSAFSLGNSDALKNPTQKRQINRQMFAIIAPRYQWITQILSFGQDRLWKQSLIRALPDLATPLCLDLACGPGDISLLLAARFSSGTVIGVDISPEMLRLARCSQQPANLHYVLADMQCLPVADQSLDIITGGYALRNAPDLNVLLQVIFQKLKPGGAALFLDFSRPIQPRKANLQAKLLKFWTRLWGRIFHGNAEVYGYIAESLALFPNVQDLRERIMAAGFSQYSCQEYLGGFTALIKFQKP